MLRGRGPRLASLDRVFDEADDESVRAVVIGIHADMWDPAISGVNDQPAAYDHFTDFVQKLARKSLRFRKPMLLINGDSHVFTDDFPLSAGASGYQRSMYGVTTRCQVCDASRPTAPPRTATSGSS